MVDKVHCRKAGNAKWNFNHNRKHFTEGEDFYLVDYSKKGEFHPFGITIPPRGIIVLTESGYLLLVKSFTDDLAWQVQKQLIKVYFRAKAQAAAVAPTPSDDERISKAHKQARIVPPQIGREGFGYIEVTFKTPRYTARRRSRPGWPGSRS